MINLKNKIALVVGGSGLIGTQITKKLLDNKAIVISTFNSSKSKIQNRKNLYSEKLNVLREKSSYFDDLSTLKWFSRILFI